MHEIYKILDSYFSKAKILHIAGAHNTGSQTLVKEILYNLLLPQNNIKNDEICVYYVDIDRKFPKSLYKNNFDSEFMKSRIFVTHSASSSDFASLLQYMVGIQSPLKNGDFLVLDTISEFVKHAISKIDDYNQWKVEIEYIKSKIIPLLVKAIVRKKIRIILLHHVSYNPDKDRNLPYYYNVFRILQGMWLYLEKRTSLTNSYVSNTFPLTLHLSFIKEVQNMADSFVYRSFERKYKFAHNHGEINFALKE